MKLQLSGVYGFTLAELLIALAVLGVIAAFTIPKVLVSQQNASCRAVLLETFAALSQLTQQHSYTGKAFANAAELKDYFRQNLNYVKLCPNNPDTEGCWYGGAGAGNADGYILHSGAWMMSVNGGAGTNHEAVAIDCNGDKPPNTAGDDVIGVTLCLGPNDCSAVIGGGGPKKAGTIGPSGGAANIAMWENTFER